MRRAVSSTPSCMRLATFLEKNDALVRKVKGAMIYPGVIMSVAAIAIAVLLIFVIPTFQNDVRLGRHGAAAADPGRDRDVASSCIGYWWASSLGVVGARSSRSRRYYATPDGKLADRQAAAQGAGARRRAPQVGRVALHPHARHADRARA